MDRGTAQETTRVIATLIGEIMEDHVDVALSPPSGLEDPWPASLAAAGEDIAALGRAIAVIARRAGVDGESA